MRCARSRWYNFSFLYHLDMKQSEAGTILQICTNIVRSGRIALAITNTLGGVGRWGRNWSSCATSTNDEGATVPSGYNLDFPATAVHPSAGPWDRYSGFSLRCLSTVLGI